jgi:hypothetical protein
MGRGVAMELPAVVVCPITARLALTSNPMAAAPAIERLRMEPTFFPLLRIYT